MFTPMEKERFLECTRAACRWYMLNQNTDARPWGGMADSADKGRFVYEYFPALRSGRGAGVWAQALGILALDAANIRMGQGYEYWERVESARLAGRYLLTLQHMNSAEEVCFGALWEHVPGDSFSFPRDGATGGMGLCALYRMTGEQEYLDAAVRFAAWYRRYGSDAEGWPYSFFSFKDGWGSHRSGGNPDKPEHKGDWQAGGALFYYYLHAITGERKYIDEYMLPMIDGLVRIYQANPAPVSAEGAGFHGQAPVTKGNDDFALITLMAAYCATRRDEYLAIARERVKALLNLMDPATGRFPSFGGTFVSGMTMHVLNELEQSLGNAPDPELVKAVALTACHGLELQARDYNEPRVNGGFWGQTSFGVSRDRIHHRSTGYAAIFYAMIAGEPCVPYYNCLHWERKEAHR